MGRIPRVEEEGLVYHVIQRGNNHRLKHKDIGCGNIIPDERAPHIA